LRHMDLLIKNGTVIDGSGKPMFRADVGIRSGKIAAIGDLTDCEAPKIIDAKGLFVTPGFIDNHSHSDWSILLHPTGDSKILQGVTTEMSGLCGYSAAPTNLRDWYKMLYVRMTVGWSMHYTAGAFNSWPLKYGQEIEVDWTSMGEYLDRIEETGVGLNYGMLVGHGTMRYWTMGLEAREASNDELETMKSMLKDALDGGALGLSAALTGCPGCWAPTSEMIELCKVVADYGGVYMPHQRRGSVRSGEGLGLSGMGRPVQETIEIAEKSNVRACCSHTPIDERVFELLESARARGVDISLDMFPYPGSIASNIVYLLPHWLTRHRDLGFDYIIDQLGRPEIRKQFIERDYPQWIAVTSSIPGSYQEQPQAAPTPNWDEMQVQKVTKRKNKKYLGKTFGQIAKMRGVDPWTAFFDLICEEEGYVRWLTLLGGHHSTDDMYYEQFEETLKVPYLSIESDAPILSPRGVGITSTDPRSYGTFPLVLSEYVRKRNVISWEQAIRMMTLNPAMTMGLRDRGLLQEGLCADICIFNPKTISHKATFRNALEMAMGINHDLYPVGVEYTIVNGVVVNDGGKLTGALPGKVLRNQDLR
jgi:N-acyl-D-amino-acid deacylase